MVLGDHFKHHLKEALEMQIKHKQLYEEFSATFQSDTILTWQTFVDTWKDNHAQSNPYLDPGPSEFLLQFL